MLALARVRRAAAKLRQNEQDVTFPALASIIGCDDREVRNFVQSIHGLKEEIALVLIPQFTGSVYEAAAIRLSEKKVPITIESLAAETGKKYTAVRAFFDRNRDLRKKIGILTNRQRDLMERRKKYESAIVRLHQEGLQVSVRAIARKFGEDPGTTCKYFRRKFDLKQLTEEVLGKL